MQQNRAQAGLRKLSWVIAMGAVGASPKRYEVGVIWRRTALAEVHRHIRLKTNGTKHRANKRQKQPAKAEHAHKRCNIEGLTHLKIDKICGKALQKTQRDDPAPCSEAREDVKEGWQEQER